MRRWRVEPKPFIDRRSIYPSLGRIEEGNSSSRENREGYFWASRGWRGELLGRTEQGHPGLKRTNGRTIRSWNNRRVG